MKNLTFAEVDYTALEQVTKRCIRYKDGNTVVKLYKKLYRLSDVLEAMDGNRTLTEKELYYLELVPRKYGEADLQIWMDFGPICYSVGWMQRIFHVSDFAEAWERFAGPKCWEEYRALILDKCGKDPADIHNYIRMLDVEIFRLMDDPEFPAVEAHKALVDMARINRSKQEQQEREQRAKEEAEREAAVRRERLENARNLLREHKPLSNEVYDGTCIFAELFEADGLKIPARTKRWMVDNLGKVDFQRNGDTYDTIFWRRSGSAKSETFCKLLNTYLEKLEAEDETEIPLF